MKKRDIVFIAELPQDYDYRFVEANGIIHLLGVNPDKKPILVDLDGNVTEIDL